MSNISSATYPEKLPKSWIYVGGTCRNEPNNQKSHIYAGPSYDDLRGPLCTYGWNRIDGYGFSILRNNGSGRGECATCSKRAELGLGPVAPKSRKTKWI